jgi:NodT family efflux transporter outer membrane factor (OMF) lipoprotein
MRKLLLTVALAGCSVAPTYERPEVPVPPGWDGPSQGEAVAPGWWQRYGSAELNGLIDAALKANHDLGAAVARIQQARAQTKIAGASRRPEVGASASASRSWRGGQQGGPTTFDDGAATLDVSYEVDLWGGNASAERAAESRLQASVFDRDAVALVLQSDVATNYLQALALKDRLEIARQNLEAARQVLKLVEVRFDEGATTGLEVAQQRAAVHQFEAQIPALEEQLRLTENAVAVLLGRPPQGFSIQGATLRDVTLPAVDPGQPASLLERRPDVRRTEARLVAANADIGAARAALYPQLQLSASAGVAGFLSGGTSVVGSLAASLAQSIFDGGRRRGQVELAEGQRQELVENYAQVVLTSYREVQDSLVQVKTSEARAASLTQAAEQAREALRIATTRYQEGAEDMLTLLDTQRTQLQTEDSLVQAELARFTASTTLFKALGGGWQSPEQAAD